MLLGLALYSMRHRNLFAAEGLDEIRDAIHHLDTPLARPLRHPFRRRRPLPDRSS